MRLMREPPSDADLEAMAQLAESTKALLAELAADPVSGVRERLQHPAASGLVMQLSPQLVDDARDRWFGLGEMADHAQAEAIEKTALATEGDSKPAGWFRDDGAGHIAYRAAEHADPFLRVLCELVAADAWGTEEREAIRSLPAVAACFECHVAPGPRVRGPGVTVAESTRLWRSQTLEDRPRGFTVFSHQPHLNIRELADCQHCHRVRSLGAETLVRDGFKQAVAPPDTMLGANAGEVAAEESVDGEESSSVTPGGSLQGLDGQFHALHRAACISCHTNRAAGNACIQCHRYHVRPPQETSSPIPESDRVAEPTPVAARGGDRSVNRRGKAK